MLQNSSELSIRNRCNLLGINRSRIYYAAMAEDETTKILKNKIAKIWSDHNNKGSRIIREELKSYEGLAVNRKRVQRLMNLLNIKGIIPKSNLSKIGAAEYKRPYLLDGMYIYMANQVWGTDLTYVKLAQGTMYIISLLDIYSRYVVGYVITNTLDSNGVIECLNQAITQHEQPYILNSDQGSQYTSAVWINELQNRNILISMDGKGRWADNIYVERFWKTLKYECIFMLGIETAKELHRQVEIYIKYYNTRRLHSALDYKTPEAVYLESISKRETFIQYCSWPPKNCRIKDSKRTVRPTIASMLTMSSDDEDKMSSIDKPLISHEQ